MGDAGAILRGVTSVVTTHASSCQGGGVTYIVRMRAPCDLHEWKDVLVIDQRECLSRLVHLPALAVPDIRILRSIKAFETTGDFSGCLLR
jgi:hypothetical protein